MSRIGRAPISLPTGVTIEVNKSNIVTVKGAKGSLDLQIDPDIEIVNEDGTVTVKRPTDQIRHRAMHGLYRALINNMVIGVSEGYSKELELIGVGYRATNTGNLLELSLGYSHPIIFNVPGDIKLETRSEKGKPPVIVLSGIDKQLVGQVAAKIRAMRKPEPYKGKGVKFVGEVIRRKAGKTAG